MFFNSFWMKDWKNQKENYTVYVLNIVAKKKNKKCFIMFYIYIYYVKEKASFSFFYIPFVLLDTK